MEKMLLGIPRIYCRKHGEGKRKRTKNDWRFKGEYEFFIEGSLKQPAQCHTCGRKIEEDQEALLTVDNYGEQNKHQKVFIEEHFHSIESIQEFPESGPWTSEETQ